MNATLGPAIGWYDPATGITWPLDHYKPEHANHLDEHKAGWRLAYAPEVQKQSALPSESLKAALAFGAGLEPVANPEGVPA